jgi:hypothetical protein
MRLIVSVLAAIALPVDLHLFAKDDRQASVSVLQNGLNAKKCASPRIWH